MKVISTNIGRERELLWQGVAVRTGIYKEPVGGIEIKKYFVEGDTVSDLRVHGGAEKAVYAYPAEHYPFWRSKYPGLAMQWGMFGENLTTEGLIEEEVLVGSAYRIGTALLEITQPRTPCGKLAVKFGTTEVIQLFLESRRSGFYFTVIEEGAVKPGDPIILERKNGAKLTIRDVLSRK